MVLKVIPVIYCGTVVLHVVNILRGEDAVIHTVHQPFLFSFTVIIPGPTLKNVCPYLSISAHHHLLATKHHISSPLQAVCRVSVRLVKECAKALF